MAFLLADAAKLTQDMFLRGIIETIVTESAVLQYLPFMTVVGSGLDYNQELTLPTAGWHAPNGTWTASEPTVQQAHAALAILGQDADVDAFIQQTYANRNDIEAIVAQEGAKSVAYAFNAAFFNGDHTLVTDQFDGLAKQAGAPVTGFANVDATHRAFISVANGATLDLVTMDQLIDGVKPGKPDVLFMSKRSRRKLSALRRASGNLLETGVNAFGARALYYDGIPIEVDDNIGDADTVGTSTTCSKIYAVQMGAGKRVGGLQNGGITTQRNMMLETKDARRTRIKWYVGLAVFNNLAYCVLEGVKD